MSDVPDLDYTSLDNNQQQSEPQNNFQINDDDYEDD